MIHKSQYVTNTKYVQVFNIYKMLLIFKIYKHYCNANPPPPIAHCSDDSPAS